MRGRRSCLGWKGQNMQKINKKIVELLYPWRCPLCGEALTTNGQMACKECLKEVKTIGSRFCLKCGKQLTEAGRELCGDCEAHGHLFTQNRGLYLYNTRMKGCIYRYKYQNQRCYAEFFAQELVKAYGRQIRAWGVEAMIPVPLHKKRQKARGFNQAELILKQMQNYLPIPVYGDFVIREKKTLPQKILNQEERQKNLKNAFKIATNSVKLKRVLLCDDIYTTGSTLDAVSIALRKNGIQEIYGLCLCIGEGK